MSGDLIGLSGEASLLRALDDLLGTTSTCSDDASTAPDDCADVAAVIESWTAVAFDPSLVSDWTAAQAHQGLAALERVNRSVAAVRGALVARVGFGRDTAAAVTRSTGMGQRAAREAVRVAETIANAPVIGERLSNGEVSASQVGAVAGLETADAVALLDVATGQSDDEFARSVERFKVETGGRTRAERQRLLRSVRFSDGPEGCLRMNAVLPPLEGAEVRGALEKICNAAWKEAHPQRARVSGGHHDEPRERRMADALVSLARGGGAKQETGRGNQPSAAEQVPSVIVTVDPETLTTTLLPDTPLDPSVLVDLLPRAQVYAAIRDHTTPARLSFGRNRRLASPLQRLVLALLQPRCMAKGCDAPAQRCEAHHRVEYDSGGLTDLDNLVNLCPAHHHHLHDHAGPGRPDRGRRSTPPELQPDEVRDAQTAAPPATHRNMPRRPADLRKSA